MADRRNWAHGETVTEGNLDGEFDNLEDAQRNEARDQGRAQDPSTGNPDQHGGICSGLVVSRNGANDYVDVTAGTAYDDSGRRIRLSTAATVKITHTGDATEGDSTDATGDGAAITGSCGAGQYIVGSLFLVYDEAQSEAYVDATGTTVYQTEAESFHFNLQIGTAFAHPPAGNPDRASLADGKVLLADLIMTNVAGSMQVVASGVCMSDADFDGLGGNYANLAGRRSDWLAMDQANYGLYDAEDCSLRRGTAREAIEGLITQLQKTTYGAGDPDGAALIGARTRGAGPLLYNAASAFTLTAGSVADQLLEIKNALDRRMFRGGDTVKPSPSENGLTYDPELIGAEETLINIRSRIDSGSENLFRIGKKRGHIALPNLFVEQWNTYRGTNVGGAGGRTRFDSGTNAPWGVVAVGGGGGTPYIRNATDGAPWIGGVLHLETAGAAGDIVRLEYGHNAAGVGHDRVGGWDMGAAPFCCATFRIRFTALAGLKVKVGVFDVGGNSAMYFQFDQTVDGDGHYYVVDNAGANTNGVLITPVAINTWYTIRMAATGNQQAYFQYNNNPEVAAVPPAAFASTRYAPYIEVEDKSAGTAQVILCSQIIVSDAQLEGDMV